ncbi:condensation domain-containing protein, partial [Streptomyces sp. 7-21]|uniref:condensation domain-containing protein n=1 Tax=Streptomyces sp. 7-21 TaxID=2802283 RepID=UPI001A399D59
FAQWVVLGVPAGVGVEALERGWGAVVAAHGMLRARVVEGVGGGDVGGLSLVVGEGLVGGGVVSRVDAGGVAEGELDVVAGEVARGVVGELDVRAGVVARLVWVDAGPGRVGRLVVVVHHLVVDGVSWRVLVPDLVGAVEAVVAGRDPVVEGEGTSFRGFAAALAAQARGAGRVGELERWVEVVGGGDALSGLPVLDPVRDVAASMRRRVWRLPAGVADDLV